MIYSESAKFFAEDIIRDYFTVGVRYSLIDMGGAGGDLVSNILSFVPDYAFDVTVVDNDKTELSKNKTASVKLFADASSVPVPDKKFDLTIVRYVMPWNVWDKQINILREIKRITKGCAIIQHCGPVNERADEWRSRLDNALNKSGIDKLKRDNYFFATESQMENLFKKEDVKFFIKQSRVVHGFTDVFAERFDLNPGEKSTVEKALGDMNYLGQTTWLLDFKA